MRVAMMASYPVDPAIVPGGVPAVAHYLTKGLARRDEIDLHVICCQSDVPCDQVEERDGATIHFLADDSRFSQAMMLRPQRRKIAAVVRQIRPDLAHAQGLGLPTMAALDTGLPNLVTIHGIFWKEQTDRSSLSGRVGSVIRKYSAQSQLRRIRNVVIISGYADAALPPEGDYRRYFIRNPIGEEIFSIQNEPQRPRILVVGGLRRRKDPLTTMRVMQRVLREMPEATLHLLGPDSGTELGAEIRTYLREQGMEKQVQLLGLVPRETLWQEYRQASLLLLPSLEETAPVALGEACAVGLPAVGSDAGGIPDMIEDGVTGFVRPAGDDRALAAAVLEILKSDELRGRLARNAGARGEAEYALDAIARSTAIAYEEILGGAANETGR